MCHFGWSLFQLLCTRPRCLLTVLTLLPSPWLKSKGKAQLCSLAVSWMQIMGISEEPSLTPLFQSFFCSILRCVCKIRHYKECLLFFPSVIPFLFSFFKCISLTLPVQQESLHNATMRAQTNLLLL